jgi:hypothetical protein
VELNPHSSISSRACRASRAAGPRSEPDRWGLVAWHNPHQGIERAVRMNFGAATPAIGRVLAEPPDLFAPRDFEEVRGVRGAKVGAIFGTREQALGRLAVV